MEHFNDENYVKNLYKWNKNNSKLKGKNKDSNNIQSIHQWLRKVEDASDSAIKSTFNHDQKLNKNTLSASNADPCSEAHELITKWVADKIRFDVDDDLYNYLDVNEMNSYEKNVKILDEIKSQFLDDDIDSMLDIKGVDYDKYDQEYITKDIINKIMKKNIVDSKKLLNMDENKKKGIDMKTKIEMRHQIVKENREKRLRELELKRREKLEKREIELKAKQIVQKEENDKKMRFDIEQQLIEQEAHRMRLEMAEQRKRDEILRSKQREIDLITAERERQEMLNLQKKLDITNIEKTLEEKRNEMAEKRALDLVDSFLRAKSMRLVQTIFSSWYGLILDNRIKMGKAQAMADWRLSYKVFNAWKKIGVVEKVKKDQELYQFQIKIENIKNSKALRFYHNKLMEKFFQIWKKEVKHQILTKKIEYDKQKNKNRMIKFLEAASTKINEKESDIGLENILPITSSRSSNTNDNGLNTVRRSKSFENLNLAETKKLNDKSKNVPNSASSHKIRKNRATNNQNDSIETSNNHIKILDESALNKKVKEMMWPWVKTPFAINNFDNRFKAQEKLLQEQQKMMKEKYQDQQKIIQDLKYQQSQVAFKEQIALLEQIKEKQFELEKMQKIQYKQEKKLLIQQANLKRLGRNNNNKTLAEIDEFKDQEEIINDKNDLNLENLSDEFDDEPSEINKKSSSRIESNKMINTNRGKSLSTGLNVTNPKWDEFNKNMMERAKQRDLAKKEREEKRKKQEIERLELLKAQNEEKLRIEEEDRKKKQEEIKEKKRLQKELEEKRNSEKIKEQQALAKADAFYKKYLMRYYGINGLKKLIEFKRRNELKAHDYYASIVLRKSIQIWHFNVRVDLNQREKQADSFYHRSLKNTYFSKLKQFKGILKIEEAKAIRFYKFHLKFKLFESWKSYKHNEKQKAVEYEKLITEHNEFRLRKTYFKLWKFYPSEMKRARIRQKRLDELRSKVREMIPDYENPFINSQNSTNM